MNSIQSAMNTEAQAILGMLSKEIEWCKEQHAKTNHFYAEGLPYAFHLKMVANEAIRFSHLIEPEDFATMILGAYGHDLIEDTRNSYNDVVQNLGSEVADIVYACTNEKGKNRKQRANLKYYAGILDTPGAAYIKLCDRIANAKFSKMMMSAQHKMYAKEHSEFCNAMGRGVQTARYEEMFLELDELLK